MKRAKGKAIAGSSKPLCDCSECTCKKCPDVVKLLSLSTTGSTQSRPRPKAKDKKGQKKAKVKPPPNPPSILGVLQDRDDCNCEVVAKAVQTNVHTNLGLYDKRWEHINKKYKNDGEYDCGETSNENDEPCPEQEDE